MCIKNFVLSVALLGAGATAAMAQDVAVAPGAAFPSRIVVPSAASAAMETQEPARMPARHWGAAEGLPRGYASQERRGRSGLDFLSRRDVAAVGGTIAAAAAWVVMSATEETGSGGGVSAASTTR